MNREEEVAKEGKRVERLEGSGELCRESALV